MGKESSKRKGRLNKGEATEFIGFGAFGDVNASAAAANGNNTQNVASSGKKSLEWTPVYLGSDSELAMLFPRMGPKRDVTTKTKALQALKEYFATPLEVKKPQVEALQHFAYLYHSKLHYENTPRVRAAALDCFAVLLPQIPKAFVTLVQAQPEIIGMILCARADAASDVSRAAVRVYEAGNQVMTVEQKTTDTTSLIPTGIWTYVSRILSYTKPLQMHQALFQKSSSSTTTTTANTLSETQQEALEERFVRIVGTALSGLELYLASYPKEDLPTAEEARYLWKTLASPKAALRRKTYTLLTTCCRHARSLVDQDKISRLLLQNLASEQEPTNVQLLLETLLAVCALKQPSERTEWLSQYSKALTKLFDKGCHGATQWSPTVLPLVALLPSDDQPSMLTSIWKGKRHLVGTADQLEIVTAVAETAAFLLQKSSHDLSEVLAQCWLEALQVYLTRSIGNATSVSGPIGSAYQQLGKVLAKDLIALDAAPSTKPSSAMAVLEDWFWNQQKLSKILVQDPEIDLEQLAELVKQIPPSDDYHHLPKLWNELFHHNLQACQTASGMVPTESLYDFWMLLLERIPVDELFMDSHAKEKFVMNDLLRWMVIHTSSLSEQFSLLLARSDFRLYEKFHADEVWNAVLRELVAAKCDLEALVQGLAILVEASGNLDSVKSPILENLCRQVARESIIELHMEDEGSDEEFSDATELHLHYHRKAGDLLQTCAGLGEMEGLLVDSSIITHWIELACPTDRNERRSPNPVLESLVALSKNDYFQQPSQTETILVQAWRQGGDLWKDTVLPWLSSGTKYVSPVVHAAAAELRLAIQQIHSSSDWDDDVCETWSEQAFRVIELCPIEKAAGSDAPLASLQLIGLDDPKFWQSQEPRKSFAATCMVNVMKLLDEMEGDDCNYKWNLFANTASMEPNALLIQILLHLSDGSTDILISDQVRRRNDDCFFLLQNLGGESTPYERLSEWISCIISTIPALKSKEEICRGIAIVSQMLSLSFSSLRPTIAVDESDNIPQGAIEEGDSLWYISDPNKTEELDPCTVVKLHTDLPGEVYFTIRVEKDGHSQERQTVGNRLRLSASKKDDQICQLVSVEAINKEELSRRQELCNHIFDALSSFLDGNENLYKLEFYHVIASQIGLLGLRGVGSLHCAVIQKLLQREGQIMSQLETVRNNESFPTDLLYAMALALGFGLNTPASKYTVPLTGFDPETLSKALMNLFDWEDGDPNHANKEAKDQSEENLVRKARIESPSKEIVCSSAAFLSAAMYALKDLELVETVRSRLFLFASMLLNEASKKDSFTSSDYIALRAMHTGWNNNKIQEESGTEADAAVDLVGAFARRWAPDPKAKWIFYSTPFAMLDRILREKPRLAGIAARKHGNDLAAALHSDDTRWMALQFLLAYAIHGKPIFNQQDNAMNEETLKRIKAWGASLVEEEVEELQEDCEAVCQWTPQVLLNDIESWQDASQTGGYHVAEDDAASRFTSWLAFLRIVGAASSKDSFFRTAFHSYTRRSNAVNHILDLAMMYANVSTDRRIKFAKVDNIDDLLESSASQQVELPKFAWAVLFRTIQVFPTLSNYWWESSCPNYFREPVRDFVQTHVAPELLRRELQRIKAASSFGEMTVKGSLVSRQVTALVTQDDFTLSVLIQFPASFPFQRAEVDCSKTLGIPESRWKRWSLQITQMLNNQGGSLTDALLLWKENVDKEFEGIEPCPVCYSVLHVKTHKLPEMQCKTCKNCFHFDCLTQWFRSSGKSSCVLCQQPWSGTRV